MGPCCFGSQALACKVQSEPFIVSPADTTSTTVCDILQTTFKTRSSQHAREQGQGWSVMNQTDCFFAVAHGCHSRPTCARCTSQHTHSKADLACPSHENCVRMSDGRSFMVYFAGMGYIQQQINLTLPYLRCFLDGVQDTLRATLFCKVWRCWWWLVVHHDYIPSELQSVLTLGVGKGDVRLLWQPIISSLQSSGRRSAPRSTKQDLPAR